MAAPARAATSRSPIILYRQADRLLARRGGARCPSIWCLQAARRAARGCRVSSGHPPQADYRPRGSRSRAAAAFAAGSDIGGAGDIASWHPPARPSPQDPTHMPPSGDAQPLCPLLPSTDEGKTTGRKDRNGCPQARVNGEEAGYLPRAQSANSSAGHGALRRSAPGRQLAGGGVSAGRACPDCRSAWRVFLDGRWAAWFDGLQISGQGEETVIWGLLADQPALHGLLTKVRRPRALPDLRASAGHWPGQTRRHDQI